MKKCIHCLEWSDDITEDHVFPESWYPESTPQNMELWTAPACRTCNGKLGKIEDKLLTVMGMCVDPKDVQASGIPQKALRAIGVRAQPRNKKDAHARKQRMESVLREIRVMSKVQKEQLIPGYESRVQGRADALGVQIPTPWIGPVSAKIVRGLEYVIGGQRYVESNYGLTISFSYKEGIPDMEKLLPAGLPITRGPGFAIMRYINAEDAKNVIYKITLWNTFLLYGVVHPKGFIPTIKEYWYLFKERLGFKIG